MKEGGNGEDILHYKDFKQDVVVGSFLLGLSKDLFCKWKI